MEAEQSGGAAADDVAAAAGYGDEGRGVSRKKLKKQQKRTLSARAASTELPAVNREAAVRQWKK